MNLFEKYAKVIVILAVVAGSASGIFTNLISASPMAIGFLRLGMALPFFAVPVLIKHRDELLAVSGKDLLWSFGGGAFLCGHFFCWFSALKLTNVASAAVLASFHPVVVLIITILIFKRTVNRNAILGIAIALVGGVIIAGVAYLDFSGSAFTGDIFAVFTGVFMGLYFAVGNHVRQRVSGSTYVFLMFVGCFICFSIGMVVTETPVLTYPASDYLYVFAMAVVCQIGSHAMFNLCMGHVDSLYVSTWETGESVFAIILSMIFLSQFPSLWECVGAVVVIGGLLYYNYQEGKTVQNEEN